MERTDMTDIDSIIEEENIDTSQRKRQGPLVNGAGSTNAKIKKGFFPYINIKGVKPPDHAPPYDIIPPNISKLFYRCFVLGHKDPKKRPIAKEWLDVLRREIGQ